MAVPNTVTINSKRYFCARELRTFDQLFFRGCGASVRGLITKYKVPNEAYLYVDKVMDNAKPMDSKVLRAKLVVDEQWVIANHPKLNGSVSYEYDPLPNLIILEDHEKFMDDEGNLYNVDTRGERDEDRVFFKVDDVAKVFGMDRLIDIITNQQRGYEKDIHYRTFVVPNGVVIQVPINDGGKHNGEANDGNRDRRTTYLTYEGLLKVIYSSRGNSVVHRFRRWASRIIYTAHMGTIEQRKEVASFIHGVSTTSVKEVMGCSSTSVSCIYLFCLGSVMDLKETIFKDKVMDENVDSLVFKFGRTNDLKRRTGEHKLKYGSNIALQRYAYIDPQFTIKAEMDLKTYLRDDIKATFMDTEVVTLNVVQMDLINSKFRCMAEEYGGCMSELNRTITDLKHELELCKRDLKLKDKDMDIMNLKFELLQLNASVPSNQ